MLINEWSDFLPGPVDATRHFMFLGETGSGKTWSGIMPVCRSAFSKPAAGLVIDPKSELGAALVTLPGFKKRIIMIDDSMGPVVWLYDVIGLGNTDTAAGLTDHLLTMSDSYQDQLDSREQFWPQSARLWLQGMIAVDLALYAAGGVQYIEMFWRHFYGLLLLPEQPQRNLFSKDKSTPAERRMSKLQRKFYFGLNKKYVSVKLLDKLIGSPTLKFGYSRSNYIKNAYDLVTNSLFLGGNISDSCYSGIDDDSYKGFWGFLMKLLQAYHVGDKKIFNDEHAYFSQFTALSEQTYSSILSVFNAIVADLISPEFSSKISLNPFEPPKNMLPVADVIEKGKIVVYKPGSSSRITAAVGKTMKAVFFKQLLCPDRLKGTALPFYYVCDEFQRFITFDEESGEQSFMDRCRAYKVSCTLATQSISSLKYILADKKGEESINILLNNAGTKLFFRTTDEGITRTLLKLLPLPSRPDRPHIVAVRPLSTLQPGECYYMSAGGATGRGRVKIKARFEV